MFKHIVWKVLSFVALTSVLAAQQTQPHLRRLAGIAAEYDDVAIDGNTVSVFSTGDISLQDVKTFQWKLADKKDDAVTIRVEGAGWRELPNHLPLSTAHSFAFCDRLNQVDVGSVDHNVRSVLPAEARVKSLVRVGHDLQLVVYSVSRKTVSYDIRVGVLKSKASGGYSLIDDDLATNSGNFCGVEQGDGGVFFVFADEPSGSSDFSSVYVYSILGKDRGQR